MAPEIVPLSMKIEFWRWVVVKKDTNYPGGVTGLKGVSKIFDENKEKKRKKILFWFFSKPQELMLLEWEVSKKIINDENQQKNGQKMAKMTKKW